MFHFNPNLNFLHLKHHYSNISKLTISHTIHTFAISLISVFFPIFLYSNGYSIIEILTSLLFKFSVVFLVFYFALKLVNKKGIKLGFLIGYLFFILFYSFLYFGNNLISLYPYFYLFFSMFLILIGEAFYYASFHLDFTKNFDNKTEGKQLGIIYSLPSIATIFAPLLGGNIISKFSFEILFILVLILLFIAYIPIFYFKNEKGFCSDSSFKKVFLGNNKQLNIIYLIEGFFFITVGILWPILLFLLSISLTLIGGFYVISNFINAVATYFSGYLSDILNKTSIFKRGSFLFGISVIFRPLFESIYSMVSFQGLGGLTASFMINPFHSIYYKQAKKDPLNLICNREFYLFIGRSISIILTIVLLYLFSLNIAIIGIIFFSGILILLLSFFVKNLE